MEKIRNSKANIVDEICEKNSHVCLCVRACVRDEACTGKWYNIINNAGQS